MPKPFSLQMVSCLKEPQGRYDTNDRDTYSGLNRALPPLNVRTAIGKVQDPSERDPTAPQQRIAVTINRNVDVLETERIVKKRHEWSWHETSSGGDICGG